MYLPLLTESTAKKNNQPQRPEIKKRQQRQHILLDNTVAVYNNPTLSYSLNRNHQTEQEGDAQQRTSHRRLIYCQQLQHAPDGYVKRKAFSTLGYFRWCVLLVIICLFYNSCKADDHNLKMWLLFSDARATCNSVHFTNYDEKCLSITLFSVTKMDVDGLKIDLRL